MAKARMVRSRLQMATKKEPLSLKPLQKEPEDDQKVRRTKSALLAHLEISHHTSSISLKIGVLP